MRPRRTEPTRASQAALLVSLVLLACGGEGDLSEFRFQAEGFEDHGGSRVGLALIRVDDGAVLDRQFQTVSQEGAFERHFGPVLEPGVQYRVDGFVDVDGDLACDPEVDFPFRALVDPVGETTTYTLSLVQPGQPTPAACASFD